MSNTRVERDTFGPIDVPADHLWGAQTQRSLHHFHISTERMAPELIAALAEVKRAAAAVNRALGCWTRQGDAIMQAADEVLAGTPCRRSFRCRSGRPAPARRPT